MRASILDAVDVVRDRTGTPTLGLGQLVVLDASAEDLAGIGRHWTVEIGSRGSAADLGFQLVEVKQHALRPPHRKCRDDHRSAAGDSGADDLRQGLGRITLVMAPIAVGRFDREVAGAADRYRIGHDGIVVAAEVAGEDSGDTGPVELDRCRPEDIGRPGAA